MKKYYLVLLLAVLVLMSACTSNSAEDATKKEEVSNTESKESSETEQAEEADTVFSLENDGIDHAKFEEALSQFPSEVPERVITTSVPLTEMLHLLGVTPVGVPTSTNPIPTAFDAIERIGSPMAPDLEVVTNLKPDLILGAEALRGTLDKNLEGIDLKTAYLPTDSFDDLKLSFKALGTYFDKTEDMNRVLSTILNKENELIEQGKGKELPSVMLMIGTSDSFMVMSEGSYLGSLVKKLGADNIATSVLKVSDTYSPINMEDVVAADPDIVLVLASGDHGASEDMFKKEVESNNTWTKLSAYKNDNIHILDYDIFGVTSISNAEQALTQIANYFYE
ncbi:ABC transporter substrate-binding protein [Psychrobacillus sp. INOP01]|uniref:ABC transporter substrate-binding protein n=1 Tax=Psychrobacillus sp. INOP01 TaxID=2829187 RepID=UPI001BAD2924|nr:ABC transporter substrate-binding protein [Psychrobacillus sp. INOP01]QUG42921.1 ABC transporter substrate-binding protein [Psychrobacillus sp. INOP01]